MYAVYNFIIAALLLVQAKALCYNNDGHIFCENTTERRIFDEILMVQADLTTIRRLTVNDSNIPEIKDWPSLLSRCSYMTVTYARLANISEESLKIVQYLNLSHNQIESAEFLKSLKELYEVDLSYNKIQVLSVDVFKELSYLRYINLASNKLNEFDSILPNYVNTVYLNDNSINKLNISMTDRCSTANFDGNNLESFPMLYCDNLSCRDCGIKTINNSDVIGRNYIWTSVDFSNNFINNTMLNISELNIQTLRLDNNPLDKINSQQFSASTVNLYLKNCSITKIEGESVSERLSRLDLSHNRLQYLDSKSFNNSRSLLNLYLNHNSITVIEEGTFNHLGNIQLLDISQNYIQNMQTYKLQNLTTIQSLNLSSSGLSMVEVEDFKNYRYLSSLNISNFLLEDLKPDQFSKISSLQSLDMSSSLRLDILKNCSFCNMRNLHNLFLRNSSIKVIDGGAFHNLYPFVYLDLNGSEINTIKTGAFQSLGILKTLNLSHLGIEEIESEAFYPGNDALMQVDLSYNKLVHIPTNTFFGLLSLQSLYLTGNKIKSLGEAAFGSLVSLNLLELSYDGLLVPDSFFALQNLQELTFVDSPIEIAPGAFNWLNSTRRLQLKNVSLLTGFKEGMFLGLRSIEAFNHTTLTELFKDHHIVVKGMFKGLESIRSLNLSSLLLADLEVRSFQGPHLDSLILSHNKIRTIDDDTFEGLQNLTTLSLSHNYISELNNKTLQHVTSLEYLSLAFNNLTHLHIGTFVGLTQLKHLDLSFNRIKRVQEATFFPLVELRVLEFDGNGLLTVDYNILTEYFDKLEYFGIRDNNWECEDLKMMILELQKHDIRYNTSRLELGINGVKCENAYSYFYY